MADNRATTRPSAIGYRLSKPPLPADAWLRWVVVLSGAAQVVTIGLFMWTMWSRSRAVGSRVREAKGARF